MEKYNSIKYSAESSLDKDNVLGTLRRKAGLLTQRISPINKHNTYSSTVDSDYKMFIFSIQVLTLTNWQTAVKSLEAHIFHPYFSLLIYIIVLNVFSQYEFSYLSLSLQVNNSLLSESSDSEKGTKRIERIPNRNYC